MTTETITSYKVEVQERRDGPWVANAQRFATEAEAESAKFDLSGRWFGPFDFRVAPSEDQPNYAWVGGQAVRL